LRGSSGVEDPSSLRVTFVGRLLPGHSLRFGATGVIH
jgi:hypothetical protein